jgi:polyisoprenoid-binding protein YceI
VIARITMALALAASTAASAAAPEIFIIDSTHTFPTFEVSHLGISTQRGRFDHTTGRITLDRVARSGSISIEIDAGSVSTGSPKLDIALRGEDFFNAEKFPRLNFHSDKLVFENGEPVRAEGELTLLGVTKPVTLKLLKFACTNKPFLVRTTCGTDLLTAISRSSFGMTAWPMFIGDEVRLEIQVEAVKQEPIPENPLPGS